MKALILSLLILVPAPPQAPTAAPVKIICPTCNGDGVVDGGTCPTCHGRKYLEGIPLLSEAAEPHPPTPPCPNCQCGCTVTGKCFCKDCDHPLLTKPTKPIGAKPILTKSPPDYSFLVLSKSDCPPCERLRAELTTQWATADSPDWDIWKNSPGTEAAYGGVAAYPTIILLHNGREVARREGYASAADLKRWAEDH